MRYDSLETLTVALTLALLAQQLLQILAQLLVGNTAVAGVGRAVVLLLVLQLFIGAQLESEARAVDVVNALRDRHVLVSASGPANDTLKIRPPLPFSTADATLLLTELDAVLR